ncbi:hypothetical protein AKJ41_04950 [candidate division MSBL1 archaeon SCGC-AAA259O05]|uniref:Uncharacterized protein n=1 Tax=candidate division MSBL1 archaeon SCGC-AAA259O05 TaxID=1698271 RepID=A0A133UZZ2_9EURY|nr:hypothetical protein AKJ41_04950 [candidate division MSBL1 archaeon SCGC-AAA259O05]
MIPKTIIKEIITFPSGFAKVIEKMIKDHNRMELARKMKKTEETEKNGKRPKKTENTKNAKTPRII